MYYGAIEAGGTKFVCAASDEKLNIVERISIPTTYPEETLMKVFDFFDKYDISSIGIGSFGPIDINKSSKTYGFITNTPKEGWQYFDFVGTIKKRYDIPVAWTTDVNAAGYGEYKKGASENTNSSLYLTIGTGVGGSAIINGEILEGLNHPEMGHILIRKHPNDEFLGACPNHGNCLEGLASGHAIEQRFSKKAYDLTSENPYWDIEAYYLAQAIMTYTLVLSPEKIILGGGVTKQEHLFPLIEKHLHKLLSGYIDLPDYNNYITSPKLKDNAGIIGSLLLAKERYVLTSKEYIAIK